MTKNVGMYDRIARVVLALLLAWLGASLGGAWVWILLALAVVLLLTAMTSYCPIEQAIGMNTLDNKINLGKKG
jgi:hypothetical protein